MFPHWDELDGFWRELPNYNPIGVSNATGGIDHGGRAESLFRTARSEVGNTSGIEDDAVHSPKWDLKDLEHSSVPRGRSMSSTGVGEEVDELISDEVCPI